MTQWSAFLLGLSLLDDDGDDCSHNCLADLLVSENMMMMTHTMEMMMVSKRNKKQVVHHDASDKLFGYNTSSSTWQVPPITILHIPHSSVTEKSVV